MFKGSLLTRQQRTNRITINADTRRKERVSLIAYEVTTFRLVLSSEHGGAWALKGRGMGIKRAGQGGYATANKRRGSTEKKKRRKYTAQECEALI